MLIELGAQARGFLTSVCLGAALLLLFDLFRAGRRTWRCPDWVVAIQDGLFCLLATLGSLLFWYGVESLTLRGYLFLGALCGGLCCRLLFGPWPLRFFTAVLGCCRRLGGVLLFPILRLLALCKRAFAALGRYLRHLNDRKAEKRVKSP